MKITCFKVKYLVILPFFILFNYNIFKSKFGAKLNTWDKRKVNE